MKILPKSQSLGNYQEALHDAEAARKLQPSYMKAIERGNV